MGTDAQKALGADGYWSRQIINSKPIFIQSKDNCIDESEWEGGYSGESLAWAENACNK